jgi:uncharacterized protein (DUF2062 family)
MYVGMIRSPGAPREVALGMAIGLLVAFIPIPAQMLLAVGIVEIVRRATGLRASPVAAALGSWFSNPLTSAPIIALSVLIGRPVAALFLGGVSVAGPEIPVERTWLQEVMALESVLGFFAGSLMLSAPVALIGYEVTRRSVAAYQQRRIARQRARALRAIGLDPDAITEPHRIAQ